MTRDQAKTEAQFGALMLYVIAIIAAEFSGSGIAFILVIIPALALAVGLACYLFIRWVKALVFLRTHKAEHEMHVEVDPDQWPCLMIRVKHEPHRWYPSPGKLATCPGWPK